MGSAQYDIALACPPTNVDNNTKVPLMDVDSSTTTMDVDSPTTMNVDSSTLDIDSSIIVGNAVPNIAPEPLFYSSPMRCPIGQPLQQLDNQFRCQQQSRCAPATSEKRITDVDHDTQIFMTPGNQALGQQLQQQEAAGIPRLASRTDIHQASNRALGQQRRRAREATEKALAQHGHRQSEPSKNVATPSNRVLEQQRRRACEAAEKVSAQHERRQSEPSKNVATPSNRVLGQQRRRAHEAAEKASAQHERRQCEPSENAATPSNRVLGQQRRRAREAAERVLTQQQHQPPEPPINATTPSNQALGQQRCHRAYEVADTQQSSTPWINNCSLGQQRRRICEQEERLQVLTPGT
ncbi:hypothetical protein HHX47_DHR5001090 [Lentinula edodes]|nr:hypothetical protein HHX47_DHR5001090 [Lentinula edodes]